MLPRPKFVLGHITYALAESSCPQRHQPSPATKPVLELNTHLFDCARWPVPRLLQHHGRSSRRQNMATSAISICRVEQGEFRAHTCFRCLRRAGFLSAVVSSPIVQVRASDGPSGPTHFSPPFESPRRSLPRIFMPFMLPNNTACAKKYASVKLSAPVGSFSYFHSYTHHICASSAPTMNCRSDSCCVLKELHVAPQESRQDALVEYIYSLPSITS